MSYGELRRDGRDNCTCPQLCVQWTKGSRVSLKTSQSPSMVQNVQSTHKLHMLAHKQEVRSVFNLPAGGSWERPTWDVSTKARCVDSVAWRN